MKINFSKQKLEKIVENFDNSGEMFADGDRNKIKLFDVDGQILNIKSFKKPIFINQIIYKYFRKSKAKRSFENAKKLSEIGINTPKPIDYIEIFNFIGLQKSFYICEHLKVDFTLLQLMDIDDFDKKVFLFKKFARFCFELHEKGIEFLDHSPGNTLFVKNGENYDLYLVDLNRMSFGISLPFHKRIKNLRRICYSEYLVKIISDEYILHYKNSRSNDFYNELLHATNKFQTKHINKRKLKKKLQFWKKL